MKENELKKYASSHNTPFYLLDLDIFVSVVRQTRELLGEQIDVCYAMKTNPFLTGRAADLLDRIEVCSTGEFHICRELGIPAEKLFISGVLKKREEIRMILDQTGGRSCYTAESLNHLRFLSEWAEENRKKIRVYPRLTSGNQFGMDEETITRIIRSRENYPMLEIAGIHFFSGTMKRTADVVEKELQELDAFFARLSGEGFLVPELEYGPGLPASYFKGGKAPEGREAFLGKIRETVASMSWKGSVTVEMGRGFAAECGYYFTCVQDVKISRGGKKKELTRYCITDGGTHQIQYDGQIRGMYTPHITLLGGETEKNRSEKTIVGSDPKTWKICGCLCTGNDVLVNEFEAEDISEGDVLVFHNAGAYSMMEGPALFLSHELPEVLLKSDEKGTFVARKRTESFSLNMVPGV